MIDTYHSLENAFYNAGIDPPEHIQADGQVHRYTQPDKPKSQSSWYVIHDSGYGYFGRIGDWRLNIDEKLSLLTRPLSNELRLQAKERADQARKEAARQRQEQWQQSAQIAEHQWQKAIPASQQHPYLAKKKIPVFGLKSLNDYLVVPLFDVMGVLWSVQTISPHGDKRFLKGGKIKGLYYTAQATPGNQIFICEGVATSHSVAQYTMTTTLCAFNAGNLPVVAEEIKNHYPSHLITIAADNDPAGIEAAQKARDLTGARISIPPTMGMDFNDWLTLEMAL